MTRRAREWARIFFDYDASTLPPPVREDALTALFEQAQAEAVAAERTRLFGEGADHGLAGPIVRETLERVAAEARRAEQEAIKAVLARASRCGGDGLLADLGPGATKRDEAWVEGYNEALADLSREIHAAIRAQAGG